MNHSVYKSFFEQYGIPDASVFAPGRANIIGEHTDYNDGFVMPFAIGQGVWFLPTTIHQKISASPLLIQESIQ
ncbi:MAG: galactokinase family protein [Saprospiraceae bacterium]|nr:galactokinase family protein [Saprospiraceae bacterium]